MSTTPVPPQERDAVWGEVRERLRSTLNSQTYKFAFASTRPVLLADDRIVLAVESELLRLIAQGLLGAWARRAGGHAGAARGFGVVLGARFAGGAASALKRGAWARCAGGHASAACGFGVVLGVRFAGCAASALKRGIGK